MTRDGPVSCARERQRRTRLDERFLFFFCVLPRSRARAAACPPSLSERSARGRGPCGLVVGLFHGLVAWPALRSPARPAPSRGPVRTPHWFRGLSSFDRAGQTMAIGVALAGVRACVSAGNQPENGGNLEQVMSRWSWVLGPCRWAVAFRSPSLPSFSVSRGLPLRIVTCQVRRLGHRRRTNNLSLSLSPDCGRRCLRVVTVR